MNSKLQKESDLYVRKNGKIKTGDCCITSSGDLLKKHGIKRIIHAVGPHYSKVRELAD